MKEKGSDLFFVLFFLWKPVTLSDRYVFIYMKDKVDSNLTLKTLMENKNLHRDIHTFWRWFSFAPRNPTLRGESCSKTHLSSLHLPTSFFTKYLDINIFVILSRLSGNSVYIWKGQDLEMRSVGMWRLISSWCQNEREKNKPFLLWIQATSLRWRTAWTETRQSMRSVWDQEWKMWLSWWLNKQKHHSFESVMKTSKCLYQPVLFIATGSCPFHAFQL